MFTELTLLKAMQLDERWPSAAEMTSTIAASVCNLRWLRASGLTCWSASCRFIGLGLTGTRQRQCRSFLSAPLGALWVTSDCTCDSVASLNLDSNRKLYIRPSVFLVLFCLPKTLCKCGCEHHSLSLRLCSRTCVFTVSRNLEHNWLLYETTSSPYLLLFIPHFLKSNICRILGGWGNVNSSLLLPKKIPLTVAFWKYFQCCRCPRLAEQLLKMASFSLMGREHARAMNLSFPTFMEKKHITASAKTTYFILRSFEATVWWLNLKRLTTHRKTWKQL